jgi:pimeloyl-ACP methyl ester carboxylesterase
MQLRYALSPALGLGLLFSCTNGSDLETTVLGTTAIYSPTTGDIPLPNDLLYSGSTDGTLNIPIPTDPGQAGVVAALNGLDGWSLGAAWQIAFSAALDPLTVVPGTTVRFFEVTTNTALAPVGGPVTGVVEELTGTVPNPLTGLPVNPAADYLVTAVPPDFEAIAILPLRPLTAKTTYMVNVLSGVEDSDGDPVTRSIVYQLAAQTTPVAEDSPLAPLQGVILSMHAAAAAEGIDPADIVISQQFTTQSTSDVFSSAAAALGGNEAAVIAGLDANPALDITDTDPNPDWAPALVGGFTQVGDTGALIGSPANGADVWQGALGLPYLLASAEPGGPAADDLSNDASVLAGRWQARYGFGSTDTNRHLTRFNTLPEIKARETIPVLLSVPKTAKPVGGWPVVLFQHGITRNRLDMLAVADSLAFSGFAVVAIDLPLHGLASDNGLFVGYAEGAARERTFGLDLVNNTTSAPGPDGTAEVSGFHFLNLANLAVGRDNLRQASLDQLALTAVLASLDYDGGGADLDATDLHYVGHSLGAMTGVPALALSTGFQSASLAMPGGGIAWLLAESPAFGPTLEAGLAGFGILPGTPEFAQFLFSAQTVIDSGDPLHYAADLSATGLPIHLVEIVGQTGVSDPDQTIPNSVAGQPLSGTEPLISALELTAITSSVVEPTGVRGAVRFIAGDHASILLPTASPAAFSEIQAQVVEFALTNGQSLTIGNPSVIQQ